MIPNLQWFFRMEKTKSSKYKGKTKRGAVSGFDGIGGTNTEDWLQLLKKNKPEGDWRQWKQIKICYGIINWTWTYNFGGNGGDEATEFIQKLIAPFGLVQHMEELVKQEKCQHNYQVLPNDVKEAFPLILKETYNSSAIFVQCSNTGDQFGTFYWLHCTYCINHFLPTASETYKGTFQNQLRLRIWWPTEMKSKSTTKR